MRTHGWPAVAAALALMGLLSSHHLAPAAEPVAPDLRPVPRVPFQGPAVSTIDNFEGFVGSLGSHGTGTDAHGNALDWNADLSFMQGSYIARDGSVQTGTFAFI